MTEYEVWQLWLQGIGAAGTFLIAVLAIWGEPIRRWATGPKLSLRLLNQKGKHVYDPAKDLRWRYYHLKVSNERPSATTHNVRVLMRKVVWAYEDGTAETHEPTSPVQMRWHNEEAAPEQITMGPEAHVADLGQVAEASREFQLEPIIVPDWLMQHVPKGQRVLIEFQAVSDEAKSRPLWVEIWWDGKWAANDDEMAKHLKVRECSEQEVRNLTH